MFIAQAAAKHGFTSISIRLKTTCTLWRTRFRNAESGSSGSLAALVRHFSSLAG